MVNWKEYYKDNKDKYQEKSNKYQQKIMEEQNFSTNTEYNSYFRQKTAANKNMSPTEYNRYLEQRKADKLGLSLRELRHFTYISKKTKTPLYECIGMTSEEYYEKLKN